MTNTILAASAGLLLGGPFGALLGASAARVWIRRRLDPRVVPPQRLVIILLLIELRSGLSVLAALQETARRLPEYPALRAVARTATVSGLVPALSVCDEGLHPIMAQLARAQKSGSSLTSALRRMLDQDLTAYRSDRLTAARALPVKLMVPVTLLMLPGLVLLLYAPGLLRTFSQLTGRWP